MFEGDNEVNGAMGCTTRRAMPKGEGRATIIDGGEMMPKEEGIVTCEGDGKVCGGRWVEMGTMLIREGMATIMEEVDILLGDEELKQESEGGR